MLNYVSSYQKEVSRLSFFEWDKLFSLSIFKAVSHMGPHTGNIKSDTHITILYLNVETILIWQFLGMALYKKPWSEIILVKYLREDNFTGGWAHVVEKCSVLLIQGNVQNLNYFEENAEIIIPYSNFLKVIFCQLDFWWDMYRRWLQVYFLMWTWYPSSYHSR